MTDYNKKLNSGYYQHKPNIGDIFRGDKHHLILFQPDVDALMYPDSEHVTNLGFTTAAAFLSEMVKSRRQRKKDLSKMISPTVYDALYIKVCRGLMTFIMKKNPHLKKNEYVIVDGVQTQLIPLPKRHDLELLGTGSIMYFRMRPSNGVDKEMKQTLAQINKQLDDEQKDSAK